MKTLLAAHTPITLVLIVLLAFYPVGRAFSSDDEEKLPGVPKDWGRAVNHTTIVFSRQTIL